ncbi:MAG: PRC-barrel domain-containing protein, partial [Jatrophihabitans endophyticus]
SDIVAFGADAVTVDSADKITKGGDDLAPLLEKRNHLHKKRVLSVLGDELGSVRDIDFDPATGTVASLILDTKAEVPGSRVVGVGSYAVVVETDTAPAASAPSSAGSASDSSAPEPSAPRGQASAEAAGAATPTPDGGTSLTLTPPDLSQAQRASYPPAE